nr:probable LRR receptor-like serine/threonine-protein kinase At1g06840 [Ipomoea trifida]
MASLRIPLSFIVCIYWSLLFTGVDSQVTDPNEVEALLSIKKSLVDPYDNLRNWSRGDPCTSKWTGVLCHNSTKKDNYLHVQELQLLQRNLSGTLSPELGRLSYMEILDVMWNQIGGSIPNEIGNITSLKLLLLNGNNLTGPLPEEIGYLPNLDRIQIDQNHISGPLPKSFANLNRTKHFHMNNNSISGQIPPELSRLPMLVHLLLDNNNLSGYIPPELAKIPNLLIVQLDNNHFEGQIPDSFGKIPHLLKLSLKNCSLRGPIPDLSNIENLTYIDLSFNQLTGKIPTNKLSKNITTIDLSHNNLNGSIPTNFSRLPRLERLSLENNSLTGSVPSIIWQNRKLNGTEKLILDFQNNMLSNISGSQIILPKNVTVRLHGNPLCRNENFIIDVCGPTGEDSDDNLNSNSKNSTTCSLQTCPPPYESAPAANNCFCALPLLVEYRLKSPGFQDFRPHQIEFEQYLTSGLVLNFSQLDIDEFTIQPGPRVKMSLKFFPTYNGSSSSDHEFNRSELFRIMSMFTGWLIPDNDLFGPYELLGFNLLGNYKEYMPASSSSGLSKGALAGIIVGTIAGALIMSTCVSLLILKLLARKYHPGSKKRRTSISVKIDGVRDFTFEEMALATQNFDNSSLVGRGGYGKVYKGILADGTVVAIKRAQEGSLQGEKEFLTEIELLSRLHHRNLVSLIGYCGEEGDQMLVYEFMSNGTLRDHLSGKSKEPLDFAMRLRIALGSAKGILYLHTEADPPIFHRDIKASNILLDTKLTAKVADFGLSRLAPVPDLEGVLPAHVSTVVKGTPGYLDPEYFLTHKLTDKSDVYSLGVVFLEILTGKHPISHGKNIVREVNNAYRDGGVLSVIDEQMGSYPVECVEKFATLALKCCQDETDARPSMIEVVRELEEIWYMMPDSDKKITDSKLSMIDPHKTDTSPSSLLPMKHPYASTDISGSDLISGGILPNIAPR